jgi:hypothetical protein
MSRFNTSTSHPLIPNSQEYVLYKKFVSIHSEDRDQLKYPNSSEFEIELPQDYLNVEAVKLSAWSFPSNYNVISADNGNNFLFFSINHPYKPPVSDPLQDAIYEALNNNISYNYSIEIEDGFYNPPQMAKELTNKMNEAVYNYIKTYLDNNYPSISVLFTEYEQFVVVYNEVSQNIWFGNRSSGFIIENLNKRYLEINSAISLTFCKGENSYPEYANYGLPSILGLPRKPMISLQCPPMSNPRFYYGDVLTSGDNGYWLKPDPLLPGSTIHYTQALLKINLMGQGYFYMEIAKLNNIDETVPFAVSKFTRHTNETSGVVNSAFAKIPIPTTPISQWYDSSSDSYMYFEPPAERIRKLKIKIRYHNGKLVNFGLFEYSFTLEFALVRPQINKKSNIVTSDNF